MERWWDWTGSGCVPRRTDRTGTVDRISCVFRESITTRPGEYPSRTDTSWSLGRVVAAVFSVVI